jgi:hypothetical protein
VDTGSPKRLLGQLLLERELLTAEQLEVALAEHLSTGRKLGEVLVERGWLTPEHVAELLEEQAGGDGERRGIELLRTRVAEAEAELEPAGESAEESAAEDLQAGHLLFVWSPAGYALLGRSGEPPAVGSEVGVSGGTRVVTKIGASPLPGDPRPCAYLDAAV